METNKKVNQTRHPPNGLSIWSTGRCNEKKGPAHTTRISITENAGPSNQILPKKKRNPGSAPEVDDKDDYDADGVATPPTPLRMTWRN